LKGLGGNGRRIVTIWSARAGRQPIRVWPDGCRDLIVCVKPTERPTAVLTGLDADPYSVRVPEGTVFIGVRLAPGALARWESEVEANPRGVLPLGHVGHWAASWLHSVSQHPERAIEYLVEAVERWFQPGRSIVQDFLGALEHTPGRVPRLTMSQRTLRRRIGAATGAPPQFWVGLHRARLAGRAVLLSKRPIVDVAVTAGYADQAHLTREMRRWFGVTPAVLRRDAKSFGDLLTAPDAFTARTVAA
jgi:hypothetical protein